MLRRDERVSELSEEERRKLAHGAIEAIIREQRGKKGSVRGTRRNRK